MDGIDLDFTGWGMSAWIGGSGAVAQVEALVSDSELHEAFGEMPDEPCLRLSAEGPAPGECLSVLVPLSALLTARVTDDRVELDHDGSRIALWRSVFDPEDFRRWQTGGFGSGGTGG